MAAGDVLYLPGDMVTLEAGEALAKGDVVYVSGVATETDYLVAVSKAGPTDAAIAVAQEAAAAVGDAVTCLLMAAVVELVANEAITIGAYVTGGGTTAGRVSPFDTTAVATGTLVQYVIGVAFQAASADGDAILVAVMQWGNMDSGQAP